MANVTIEEMSIIELKATLFDQIVILERTQKNIQLLQDEVNKKIEAEKSVQVEVVKDPTTKKK